jgi:hypothetical protein
MFIYFREGKGVSCYLESNRERERKKVKERSGICKTPKLNE